MFHKLNFIGSNKNPLLMAKKLSTIIIIGITKLSGLLQKLMYVNESSEIWIELTIFQSYLAILKTILHAKKNVWEQAFVFQLSIVVSLTCTKYLLSTFIEAVLLKSFQLFKAN